LSMIKAVFFDWVGTLARPEPDSHEIVRQVAQELGVELPRQGLINGIHTADNEVPVGSPPRWSEGKDEKPFICWWKILSAELGIEIPRDVMLQMTRRLSQVAKDIPWVLYDDVLPALEMLKQRGLVLGLISNVGVGQARVGLGSYLDFVVTPEEAGAAKPKPPIFRLALKRAGVGAQEAIYVGDTYKKDVLGARGVGIKPVLIDRYDLEPEAGDCQRIRSLAELDSCL
jgi:putative hydrolase of the HAD superfamily